MALKHTTSLFQSAILSSILNAPELPSKCHLVFYRVFADYPLPILRMPFWRSLHDPTTGKTNPREHINNQTIWIDGSSIYGPNEAWTKKLRAFKDGKMKLDEKVIAIGFIIIHLTVFKRATHHLTMENSQ